MLVAFNRFSGFKHQGCILVRAGLVFAREREPIGCESETVCRLPFTFSTQNTRSHNFSCVTSNRVL